MRAHIITIGDELLIGQVIDTNSAFIARELNKIGVRVSEISSIQDNQAAIINALDYAQKCSDIVILTGGLGATKDDITKRTLAHYFKDELAFHRQSSDNMKRIFNARNIKITSLNRLQAYLPSKADILINDFGTASGMYFKQQGKHIFSLPGMPFEMKFLITKRIIPLLKDNFNLPHIIHQTIVTQGVGESFLAEILENWENSLPSFIKLAYLPSSARVRLRLSGLHKNKEFLTLEIRKQVDILKELISEYIISTDAKEIEYVLGEKLLNENLTLATAESCTGGKIAHKITSISGSSSYYEGSIISYATQVKKTILKIPESLIDNETVVSEKVALLMAKNVRKILKTDIGIATTGVAGPKKGEDQHEVGLAFVAVVTADKTVVKKYNFPTMERGQFIEKISNLALQLAYNTVG